MTADFWEKVWKEAEHRGKLQDEYKKKFGETAPVDVRFWDRDASEPSNEAIEKAIKTGVPISVDLDPNVVY